jgi:hypothetical protein
MDASYVDRMKLRLATMRSVAAMAHDPRMIELLTVTADELEEDIRKLETEGIGPVTVYLENSSESEIAIASAVGIKPPAQVRPG